MKHLKFFFLFSVLFAAAAGCHKEPDPVKPAIELASDNVTLNVDGDLVQVAYNIQNSVDGVRIAAATEAAWLTVNTEKPRIIEFSATANEGDQRTAEVVISYEGAENVTVTVSQNPFEVPFVITVGETGAASAVFSVEVADPDMTWVAQCVGKEWWDEYAGDEQIFKEDLEYFQWMANENGCTLAEYLGTVLLKGSKQNLKFNGLDPESEYVIYVYGLSVEGVPSTAIYSVDVTTTPPYDGPITFDIAVTEANHVLDITVTPTHEGVAYTWNIMDKATFEFWGSDVAEAVQAYIDYEVEDYLYLGDISSPSEYYEWYSDAGTVNSQFECMANQDYIIFAAKWNEECKIEGEVEYVWVKTEGVEASDNKITLSVSDADQGSFRVDITTTNNDPYVVLAEPASWCGWADMTDQEIYQYVMDNYGTWFITDYICQGDIENARFTGLDPDTEYTVVAFGYEAGVMTTSVVKTSISTAAGGSPEECTFDFDIIETTSTTAYVNVRPSDASHYYYWMVFPSDATADDVKANINEVINDWYYGDLWEFAYWELSRGATEGEISYLSPSTEYKVAAVIMDDSTGEFLADVVFSEPFMTTEMVYADIDITATFDKYYDGDALAAAVQDTYDQYKGYAMLPVTINVDGDYAELYCAIFSYEEGLEDPAVYTDADLYGSLFEYGYVWGTDIRYRAPWDTDLVIMAMAVDYDGNYSVIYRHKFRLAKDGASPIEDVIETKSAIAKHMDLSAFTERKIDVKRARTVADNRFSTEVLNEKRTECKAKKEATAREAAQVKLQERKTAKKLSRGVLAN